jgi:hypothetical protein
MRLAFCLWRRADGGGKYRGVESEWVVTLAAMGALFFGVVGSMARAAKRGAQWQDRVERSWRDVAESLGGELVVGPGGRVAPRRLSLSLQVDDVEAWVETNVPVDPGSLSHTRAHASFALGAGPIFRVGERSVAEPHGRGDELLTDRALAARVRVTTDEPAATLAHFSSAAYGYAASFPRPIALRSDGGAVELMWDGVELDPGVLEDALRLVAELALGGVRDLRALAELEDATYVSSEDGGPLVRVGRGRAEVELWAEPSAAGPIYLARAALHRPVPPFSVHVEADGTVDGEIPPGLIEAEQAAALAEVGESALVSDEEAVELTWASAPAPSSGEAAVRLLGAIASGSGRQGAFR